MAFPVPDPRFGGIPAITPDPRFSGSLWPSPGIHSFGPPPGRIGPPIQPRQVTMASAARSMVAAHSARQRAARAALSSPRPF